MHLVASILPSVGRSGLLNFFCGLKLFFRCPASISHPFSNYDWLTAITDLLTGEQEVAKVELGLAHWLADSLTYWLTDSLTHWLTDSLTHWLTDSLTHWLTDSLNHWLNDSPTHWFTHVFFQKIKFITYSTYLDCNSLLNNFEKNVDRFKCIVKKCY